MWNIPHPAFEDGPTNIYNIQNTAKVLNQEEEPCYTVHKIGISALRHLDNSTNKSGYNTTSLYFRTAKGHRYLQTTII
jgi:GDP-D-mannose dehydratase